MKIHLEKRDNFKFNKIFLDLTSWQTRLNYNHRERMTINFCTDIYRHIMYYLTNRFHFSVRLYSNRCTDDVKMWWEQKSTPRDEVEWRDCCSHHILTSSVHLLEYRPTEKWNLFVLYNIHRNISTNQSARKIQWRHLCVCTVITHGSRPIRARVIYQLLYKLQLRTVFDQSERA